MRYRAGDCEHGTGGTTQLLFVLNTQLLGPGSPDTSYVSIRVKYTRPVSLSNGTIIICLKYKKYAPDGLTFLYLIQSLVTLISLYSDFKKLSLLISRYALLYHRKV